MKSASAELIALMASNEFRLADLVTITLKDASVLRYTSLDIPLIYAGNTYAPIVMERGRTRVVLGVEVDSLDLRLYPTDSQTVNGNLFLPAVHAGAFDGAEVRLDRAYMPSWGDTSPGTVNLFEGRVSEIELDGLEVHFRIASFLELLNTKMPRNVYQAACINSLYDGACGASRAAFAVNGTAKAPSTRELISATLPQAAGYFSQGVVLMTSGANAGVYRNVKLFGSDQFFLSMPFVYPVEVGDTFTAWPGCDKLFDTCTNKFSNAARFRGFPWIPTPETAY